MSTCIQPREGPPGSQSHLPGLGDALAARVKRRSDVPCEVSLTEIPMPCPWPLALPQGEGASGAGWGGAGAEGEVAAKERLE